MTLLLLLRPHRYGAVVASTKGYAVASAVAADGARTADAPTYASKASNA